MSVPRRLDASFSLAVALAIVGAAATLGVAAEPARVLHRFDVQQLTGQYYSEGIAVGDINGDAVNDIVYGPLWFAGPDYKQSHEIYPPQPQPRERYADHFFCWVYDFNRDQRNDVLVVGFPGTPAYVYENTGEHAQHWPKHQVLDWVSNESPQWVDLVGDERPELVYTRDGMFGYAEINAAAPFGAWKFRAISPPVTDKRFGHGLGVGDVDGDGRPDVLTKSGWFQQPADSGEQRWPFHAQQFAAPGGADMHAYDVDGDGDNDVITSLSAHNFGLAWHEQTRDEKGQIGFEQHLIMGSKPEQNRYGLVFSEPHSVALADIDGDGLQDIVTGKTFYSHHRQSPMWDAGAVVYWFRLQRTAEGVDWVPQLAAADTGIGRQLVVADVNGDSQPDIAVGGMKGAHVLTHRLRPVTEEAFEAAQPRPYRPLNAGLAPAEAAAAMTAPSGFRVTLAAGEPLVHQPVAMAYDHRGRLWIAEAHTYPVRAPEGQGRDKILILEDTNLDGTLDSRTVFAEGLNLVSGLEVGFGGVWVGAAPYLLFIPDADQDDVPDSEPQVLLDGFGYQDTHETLNAFVWGPDGWLYGCHGVFTHSLVGKPETPEEQRIGLNAGVWRYHPLRHEFDVFARGTSNPWGVDFNDRGQAFITACVIPHLWHVVQGARYQRQGGRHFNPHIYDDIKTIADHAHYTGNIRDHAWWGHEPTIQQGTSQAGGGHAHCGAMIYLGNNWPEQYRNQIFFNNIHGNRVNCDILERHGSGFIGRHGQDLLMANDRWFRGINLRCGPDGAVHLIDWYDKNACHRSNPEVWDRTNGRVYRIAYGDVQPMRLDLSKQTSAELIGLHSHPNRWFVRMARRLLQQRGLNEQERGILEQRIAAATRGPDSDVPQILNCMWTLHATGGLDERLGSDLLRHTDEYVRGWTIQLLLEDRQATPDQLQQLVELAGEDESPVVRLYLAAALQRLPVEQRWQLAAALTGHAEDADDHNIPLMLWYGIEPLVTADAARAIQLSLDSRIPLIRRYVFRRAAADNNLLDDVVAALRDADDAELQSLLLDEMMQAFAGRVEIPLPNSWEAAYSRLLQSPDAKIRERADQVAVILGDRRIFPRMRATLADAAASLAERRQAMTILTKGRDGEAGDAFVAALQQAEMRSAALKELARFETPQVAAAILAIYPTLSPNQRRDAVNTLSARLPFARRMLAAVESGQIPRTDLHAYNVRQIVALGDEALNERLKAAWGEIRATPAAKQQRITLLKSQLTPPRLAAANLGNGRRLFVKTCASCHKLFGVGGDIGPDITGSNRANLDYLLENAVDPSAVMGRDYRMTIINTEGGRVVSGMLSDESDSAVTLRTINDTVVIAKSEIARRKLSDLSMMPEQLLDPLSSDELRDLVAYLASPAQVGLSGPAAPLDKDGKVPEAIEAESMKIVGKSSGSARSQPMGNFPDDRWSGADQLWWTGAKPGDHLSLEFSVAADGVYIAELVMTRARDYAVVHLEIDGRPIGQPVDLFDASKVVTTGVLEFPAGELAAGKHQLTVKIVGANPNAVKAYMFGLDYLRLQAAD